MLIVVIVAACLACLPTSAGAATASIGAGLHGPRGLHATAYAKRLQHLSAITEDSDGRIWAATAGLTDQGDDAIYLIAQAGATPTKVIAGVHTPLGLLWLDGALYVSEHDGVEVYRDFDGTQFASHTTIVSFPDGTGELNGIVPSADGRLLVGISAPCDACTPTSQWSASIVSFLPDGSDLRVYASGIRAAIGLAYFPDTDHLFVTMNQRDDLGAKTPGDWLSVVTEGQRWGFPACYGQGGSACAGVAAPVASLSKHAAVSGVAIVTDQLGASVGTGALVAEWTTGTVRMVRLTKQGKSTGATAQALLTGFQHPMPVFVSAPGALFVGDWGTGTIYRITG